MSTEAYSRTEPLLESLLSSVPEGRGFFSISALYMALCTSSACVYDGPNLPGMKRNQICKVVEFLSDILLAGLRYANKIYGR